MTQALVSDLVWLEGAVGLVVLVTVNLVITAGILSRDDARAVDDEDDHPTPTGPGRVAEEVEGADHG